MSYHQDRSDSRGRNDYNNRSDSRGRGDYNPRSDSRGRSDYRSDSRGRGDFNPRSDSRDSRGHGDRSFGGGGYGDRGGDRGSFRDNNRGGGDRGFSRPYDNRGGSGDRFGSSRGGGSYGGRPYDSGRGRGGGGRGGGRPNDFTEVNLKDVRPTQVVQQDQLPQEIPSERDTKVQLNAFSMDLKNAIPVYQYDLTITGIRKRDEKPIELTRHSNNDAARNLKFECLEGIFENLLDTHSTFFQYDPATVLYVYDRSKTMYSSLKLLEDKEKREFEFIAAELRMKNKDYIRKYSRIVVLLQRTNYIEPSRFSFEASHDEQIRIQHYVNLLTSQSKLSEFFMFGPKMYRKTSNIPLRDEPQFVLKEGIQKNSRAVANERGNGVELVLQMDAKKSAFHANIKLVDYVQADSYRDDLRNPSSWRSINKKIKGLCVETTHLERNKKFVIFQVTKEPADRIIFEVNGQKISVADYFQKQYNLRLRHPEYPCIMESINKRAAAYPIELLNVMDGQRIPHSQMKASLNEKMIRACQAKPVDLAQAIKNEAECIDLMNSNEYLQLAKIRIIRAGHFTEVEAKELHRPSIVYDQKQLNLKGPTWKLDENKHFLVPANIQKLAFVGRESRDLDQFVQNLTGTADRMGMHIGKFDVIPLDGEYIESVLQLARDLVRDGYTYLFFISDSKDVHAGIKFSEISQRVVTQQIKFKSLRGNDTLKNILMKMNLKAGGRNHTISTDPNLAAKFGGGVDFLRSMLKDTLIIGLEMSLPLNQMKFEVPIQQQEPCSVGYSSTVDQDANVLSGGYFYQAGRKTVINGALLGNRVCEAIKLFNVKNGSYPRQIIIYRSGASEGQFGEIKGEECENLEASVANFCSSVRVDKPKIAVLAIQKKTNHRVFQSEHELGTRTSDSPAFLQNVTPGTTITKKGTNPNYKEFIMVPQKALLGTAKPIVGTLIYENPPFWSNIDHLANLSHSLCYMHEVSTAPISCPAPLRSAEQLAQRGKNNWVTNRNQNSDTTSSTSSNNYQQMSSDEKDVYMARLGEHFDDLTNILKPTLECKFWA